MQLDSLIDEYVRHRLCDARPHTARKFLIAGRHVSRFLGRAATLDDLTEETVLRWRSWLMREREVSPATANSYVAHLAACWNYAWRRGYCNAGPTIREAPEYQREPVSLTPSEVGRLVAACRRLDYSIAGLRASDWWAALVLVLYDSGVRVTACRSLRWADVRESDCSILIRAEHQKSRKDARKSLHRETMEQVLRLRRGSQTLVFPWDRSYARFWQRSRELFLGAGFPDDRRYRLHILRRSHGTLVAKKLGNHAAAESLQHSNVRTFIKHYLDASKLDAPRRVLRALPRPRSA